MMGWALMRGLNIARVHSLLIPFRSNHSTSRAHARILFAARCVSVCGAVNVLVQVPFARNLLLVATRIHENAK